ncbi:hypothetical protein VTU32_00775 [Thermoanaerobacter sp. CM-CNRG TB177]|uniref:hypothetical protein n=1 Tax=Thermoanaerobacter sp. CM-CNRG TB177 TaxID=2800659 RepID=UPI00316BC0AB
MYPNEFLRHVNLSLRKQAAKAEEEKEQLKKQIQKWLTTLERLQTELQKGRDDK